MLNPLLYATMTQLYGEVRVVKPGIQSTPPHIYTHPVTHRKFCRWDDGVEKGEEYQCCCPFCGDTGFHLYVNYQYGRKDPCGSVIEIANCFHGCLDDPKNRHRLEYDLLFRLGRRVSKEAMQKAKEEKAREPVPELVSQKLDGVIPLIDLPEEHEAVQYILSRGYSRKTMVDYHLGYCDNPDEWMVNGRLVIPVFFKGEEIGWQARKINEEARGPKYYNSRGFPKSHVVYNFDVASRQEFVVLVEGVTDVWRIGAPAACTFGKGISESQMKLIDSTWKEKPVIFMLDNDAEKESIKYFEQMKRIHTSPVLKVNVPPEYKDPGSTPPEIIRGIIMEALHGNTR